MKVVITDYQYEDVNSERSIIETAGHELLTYQLKEPEELYSVIKDADAIITQYADINAQVIEQMENCKIIIRYGIGYNNIDSEAAGRKGIFVCNVPDYCIEEVSDQASAMILALGKKLPILTKALKNGDWGYSSVVPLFRFSHCTLGLIGFGRIPQMLAAKMQAFGMKIIAYDPYLDEESASKMNVRKTDLEELLRTSDFVSIHCPLTEETHHLVDKEELQQMKSTAFIINTARGGIINEQALIEALSEKLIAGAGLDVYESEPVEQTNPLLQMDNVIATPHSAWYSETAINSLQRKVAEEVVNVLSGHDPFNCVNQRYFI